MAAALMNVRPRGRYSTEVRLPRRATTCNIDTGSCQSPPPCLTSLASGAGGDPLAERDRLMHWPPSASATAPARATESAVLHRAPRGIGIVGAAGELVAARAARMLGEGRVARSTAVGVFLH